MIKFKLNGKTLEIPSTWQDPTLDQYLKIISNQGSVTDIISIFTGIDVETLKTSKIDGLEMVMAALSFLKTPPEFSGYCENVGKYKLPVNSKGQFDIQFESLGQFEDMRKIMNAVPDDNVIEVIKSYAKYVAIYLQKVRDGDYNNAKATEMEPEVYQMPAFQVITVGSFFFLKLLSLSNGIDLNSLTTKQSPKKSKPVSKSSKKPLAATRQSRKRR